MLQDALSVFYELREVPGLKKKPSTSEFLDWIQLLSDEEDAVKKLRAKGDDLPPLFGALLKSEQDVDLVQRLRARQGYR